MRKTLADLAATLGCPSEPAWETLTVSGICDDSRRIRSGDLFFALPGSTHNGVNYIEEAVSKGACAVVTEAASAVSAPVPTLWVREGRSALARAACAYYDHPTRDLFTVGVTGTNGKTTVCHLTAHLLDPERTVVIGTVANEARGLRAVTTPSPPLVQRIARQAAEDGRENLVIEASSIGLAQHRLDAVNFDVAVFTNLTHDHLDLHGSMDAYLDAKARLFRMLAPDARAVVRGGDRWGDRILATTRARATTYAVGAAGDLVATELEPGAERTRFRMHFTGEDVAVDLPLPGVHNVENALAAAAVALSAGHRLDEIAARLHRVPRIPGRHEIYRRDDGAIAVVDFAHSPDALDRSMQTTRIGRRHLIVVFGCPGDADRVKRTLMGEISGRSADLTILTMDNPKHEAPETIIDEIALGLRPTGGAMETIVDRARAIEHAVERVGPTDAILVAGKGHETYQIIGDQFVPHSDAAILEALGFAPAVG